MKTNSAESGFTLIELMVTVVLAGTVLTVGVPSFREMIQQNRVAAASNSFVTALHYARSEAIRRGLAVSVCRSADSSSCAAAGGWEQGWIVFTDSAALPRGTVDAGEEVLKAARALTTGLTLRGNANVASHVSFLASGFADANANGTIILCDSRVINFASDRAKARAIVISNTGRMRVLPGDDADVGVNTCTP
jgi:type IV fimbrial biogenesis protein FimT